MPIRLKGMRYSYFIPRTVNRRTEKTCTHLIVCAYVAPLIRCLHYHADFSPRQPSVPLGAKLSNIAPSWGRIDSRLLRYLVYVSLPTVRRSGEPDRNKVLSATNKFITIPSLKDKA